MKFLAVLLIILSTVSADENKYEQIANLLTDDQPEVRLFIKSFEFF